MTEIRLGKTRHQFISICVKELAVSPSIFGRRSEDSKFFDTDVEVVWKEFKRAKRHPTWARHTALVEVCKKLVVLKGE